MFLERLWTTFKRAVLFAFIISILGSAYFGMIYLSVTYPPVFRVIGTILIVFFFVVIIGMSWNDIKRFIHWLFIEPYRVRRAKRLFKK